MAFHIQLEHGDALEIALQGDLDIISAATLKTRVLEAYQDRPSPIIFDLSELDYLDSTGLGALISILKNTKPAGHSITIRKAKPNVRKLFTITELDQDFQLED